MSTSPDNRDLVELKLDLAHQELEQLSDSGHAAAEQQTRICFGLAALDPDPISWRQRAETLFDQLGEEHCVALLGALAAELDGAVDVPAFCTERQLEAITQLANSFEGLAI